MAGSQDGRRGHSSKTATTSNHKVDDGDTVMQIGGSSNTTLPSSNSLQYEQQSHHLQSSNDVSNEFSPYFLVAAAAASAQAEAARNAAVAGLSSTSTSSNNMNSTMNIDSSNSVDPPLPYLEEMSPFPMEMGSRITKSPHSIARAHPDPDGKHREECNQVGKVRCSWAILSTTTAQLNFMYADPTFSRGLSSEATAMIGTSFFDYIHPEERDRAEVDMKNIIESRTLFGSVTRCRFSRMHRIRKLLGAVNPNVLPELNALKQAERDYLAIDIVVNWIGEGMALCFFHAIMDESIQDNDEVNKTEWSNWCGMQPDSYDQEECQVVWESIKRSRSLTSSNTGPQHVFQILSSVPPQYSSSPSSSPLPSVLFSWPPPRLFHQPTNDTASASSISFADGSYFVDDFAKLAQGVNLLTLKKELSDANTSCTRRFRAKHTLTTEGMVRSVESVLIPYGSIVLACFSVTYAQMLPGSVNSITSTSDNHVMPAAFVNLLDKGDLPTNPFANQDNTAMAIHQPKAKSSFDISVQFSNGASVPTLSSLVDASVSLAKDGRPMQSSEGDQSNKGGNNSNKENSTVSKGGSVDTLAAVAAAAASQSKRCASCGTSNSPEWRKGPDGTKSLCNACGLRFSRNISRAKKREERAIIAAEVAANGGIIPPHLLKKPGADMKKTKKQKTGDGATKSNGDNDDIATTTSTDAGAPAPADLGHAIDSLQNVQTGSSQATDDTSLLLARAAAQAAAAAGLRQS